MDHCTTFDALTQAISFILKTVKINNFDQALKNYNIMILIITPSYHI
jgi:hypothetical protein